MNVVAQCSLLASSGVAILTLLPAQTPNFSNQTTAAGITGSHSPTYSAGFAAGGAVGDFNRDGFQDIYVAVGGGQPDRLFINDGDGTFTNRAAEWGIAVRHRGTGAAVGDFDGDGFLDLFVTSLGPASSDQAGAHKLYRNVGGAGFIDVAAARNVNFTGPSADGWGGAFGDYDLDGDLDLAVCGWRVGATNRLFRNDGTGFTDVTASSGIAPSMTNVAGFAARFVDMDGDRYPELLWIGDFTTSKYFVNNQNGTFTDRTALSGTANDGTEMGVTVTDVNEDGRFDFYVTTINTNNLYVNQGNHQFSNLAAGAGVTNTGWGWGTVAFDMNHDTKVDFVATTQSGRQFAFRNQSGPPSSLHFAEVATQVGINSSVSGRGLANIDYDNDGDQDLVIFPAGGPTQLFRNDLVAATDTHWLRVFLDDGCAPGIAPDGVGTVVRARIGARTWTRQIDAGSNYLSNSELSAHFGLGTATSVDSLRVEWSDGQVTVLSNVAADQTLTIRAPSTAACATSIGAGCPGANGIPRLAPRPGSIPALGTTFSVDLTGLDPGGASAVILLAFDRLTPAAGLATIGLPDCHLHVGNAATQAVAVTNVSGNATWSVAVGVAPALRGLELVMQGIGIDAGAPNPLGASMSNALRAVVN